MAVEKSKVKPFIEVPDYKSQIEIIKRPSKAAIAIKNIMAFGGPISFDYEANALKPELDKAETISCSICWRGKQTIAYPWHGEAIEATEMILRSKIYKIAQNMKFEDRYYYRIKEVTHARSGRHVACDLRKLAFFRHGWGASANDCYSDMYIHPPPYKKIYSCEASIYVRCSCCVDTASPHGLISTVYERGGS